MKTVTKKKIIYTAAVGAAAAAGGFFRYFSDMAAVRKRPVIPARVQHEIDISQDDDIFGPVAEEYKKEFAGLSCSVVSCTSGDGLTLKGTLFEAEAPRRVIVFMHGWRSSWQKDYAVLVRPLLDRGCTLLFADERSHGMSEGDHITFGAEEKKDCFRWAELLAKKNPRLPLYLWGMSMGAATVMLAAGEPEQLPASVAGIVADCGFTCAREEFEHLVSKKAPAGGLALPLFRSYFNHKYDFDINSSVTYKALHRCPYPVLFFHGADDDFVPLEMTLKNFGSVKGEKDLVIIPGAVHCKCFYVDRKTCLEKTDAFFEKAEQLKK